MNDTSTLPHPAMMPAREPAAPIPIRRGRGMQHLGMIARQHAQAWLGDPDLSRAARMILMLMAEHVNGESGEAWPSQARLGEMAGISERSARRAVRELVDAGAVDILRVARGGARGGITNRYRINRPPPST